MASCKSLKFILSLRTPLCYNEFATHQQKVGQKLGLTNSWSIAAKHPLQLHHLTFLLWLTQNDAKWKVMPWWAELLTPLFFSVSQLARCTDQEIEIRPEGHKEETKKAKSWEAWSRNKFWRGWNLRRTRQRTCKIRSQSNRAHSLHLVPSWPKAV